MLRGEEEIRQQAAMKMGIRRRTIPGSQAMKRGVLVKVIFLNNNQTVLFPRLSYACSQVTPPLSPGKTTVSFPGPAVVCSLRYCFFRVSIACSLVTP
jgi:hypothetical protein